MVRSIAMLAGCCLAAAGMARGAEPLERVGRLAAPGLREASGMVASRQHPGIYWAHSDSGNPPEIYAVRRDGQLVRSYKVSAPNVDWEDIATDDAGNLYIGDTGNNKLMLPARAIYRVAEPDPAVKPKSDAPLPVLSSHFFGYPASGRFDCEGLAIFGEQALLVTKRLDGQAAELYRLPLKPAASLLRPAIPTRVGILPGCVEPATGASLTRDGRFLAVVTNSAVRIFETDSITGWSPIGSTPFDAPDVEAITWDGKDLLLVSEDRSIYRVPEGRWRSTRGARR